MNNYCLNVPALFQLFQSGIQRSRFHVPDYADLIRIIPLLEEFVSVDRLPANKAENDIFQPEGKGRAR